MAIHHTVKTGNPMPVVQEGELPVSLQPADGTEDITLKLVDSLQNIDRKLDTLIRHLELITEENFKNGTD